MWMLWRLQRRSVELRRLCMQPVSPFQEGFYILPFGQVINCVVSVIVWFDEFLVLFCASAPLIMHGESLWKDIGTFWAPRSVFVTRTGLFSSLYLSSLQVVVIIHTCVLFLDLELTVRCDVCRPAWKSTMTPQELDLNERQSFLSWRRGLAGYVWKSSQPLDDNRCLWGLFWWRVML